MLFILITQNWDSSASPVPLDLLCPCFCFFSNCILAWHILTHFYRPNSMKPSEANSGIGSQFICHLCSLWLWSYYYDPLLLFFSCCHGQLFCDPMDFSLLVSSVHGNSQLRILEWVATAFSRGSSPPRNRTCISCIDRWILYHWATRETHDPL